jgi:hypothetical protein
VAEALRARATDPEPAAGHQERDDEGYGELPNPSRDWRGEERDREPKDDLGDGWRT